MSDTLSWYSSPSGLAAVHLPLSTHASIDGWKQVRSAMLKTIAPGFSRDEWAYLITFLDADNLMRPFEETFGKPVSAGNGTLERIHRPRGPIAVWLPSNVSLLGPLTLVLLSLTGQSIRLKLGSGGDDLAGAFLGFARNALPSGELRTYLDEQVEAHSFGRGDPQERDMAATANVRIVFGGDDAARAIHALPHPVNSVGISFADRQSEAWLETEAADDRCLTDLLRVFSIYGQAGCTSPRRVVLLGASDAERDAVFERIRDLAERIVSPEPPMHIASDTLMADQWARSLGWRTEKTAGNGALIATGPSDLDDFEGVMALKLQARSLDEAIDALPDNIQTIGHALHAPPEPETLERLARRGVARFVPLSRMHHFSSTWDGERFWARCFEVMELDT